MKRLVPFLILGGCGYVGDPRPPALNIPQPIQDLRGLQRGATLLLDATLPTLTTEGMTIEKPGEVEVRLGPPPPTGFEVNSWADSAKKVPGVTFENKALRVDAAVVEFAGKEIFVVARSSYPKGRWSEWSNILVLTVQPPLATPSQVTPESAPEGVRLTWSGDAPSYRIFRKSEGEEAFTRVGVSNEAAYNDSTAAFGKRHAYQLQGTRTVGERLDESELSTPAEITPEDKFAPAVPSGLSVLLGVSSVELAWERNLDKDLRGYYVYRAVGDGAFEKVSDLVTLPSFGDRKIENGKTYRYAVTSVDQTGNESEKSTPVMQTVAQ